MWLVTLALFVAQACAQDDESHAEQKFVEFKAKYGKSYEDDAEEKYRYGVFKAALRRIAKDNADPEDGAEYGVTRWSDRTSEELRMKCGGTCVGPNCTRVTPRRGVWGTKHAWDGTCYVKPRFPEQCSQTLPDEFDWTTKGAVTGVKDQGNCGNCFAFGATSDMEAAWYLAGNTLVSLSEQQITSCDRVGDDGGCFGGNTNLDSDEYASSKGLNSEKNYPYCSGKHKCAGSSKVEKQNGICNKKLEASPVAKFSSGYQVSGGMGGCDWCAKQPIDENLMKKHIATAGPMTIAINSKFFDNYKKGIMSPSKCKTGIDALDHQVTIVGYGTENGVDYWKIKNSWNDDWGENGYCRIKRGDNRCGVASDATHVVAATTGAIVV
jgi:C1A family cysteine protease